MTGIAKTGTKHNRGGWLKNPKVERPAEKIGGGFFVFRRGDDTGRIRPSMYPFEHPTWDSAVQEAQRLKALLPNERFDVFISAGAPS